MPCKPYPSLKPLIPTVTSSSSSRTIIPFASGRVRVPDIGSNPNLHLDDYIGAVGDTSYDTSNKKVYIKIVTLLDFGKNLSFISDDERTISSKLALSRENVYTSFGGIGYTMPSDGKLKTVSAYYRSSNLQINETDNNNLLDNVTASLYAGAYKLNGDIYELILGTQVKIGEITSEMVNNAESFDEKSSTSSDIMLFKGETLCLGFYVTYSAPSYRPDEPSPFLLGDFIIIRDSGANIETYSAGFGGSFEIET